MDDAFIPSVAPRSNSERLAVWVPRREHRESPSGKEAKLPGNAGTEYKFHVFADGAVMADPAHKAFMDISCTDFENSGRASALQNLYPDSSSLHYRIQTQGLPTMISGALTA
ncbi:hypothetical protein [Microvirga yunnanensis]|uniref:hypothetical protein n=1 Tax=Microvirga yunnanensis TaxID=2953740 RepID=UPI0021CACD39|nr:hypothetical protein [Microvirga sp. HBU65207]